MSTLNNKFRDIRAMEAFIAVVGCGSMTAAGKELGISQPAVTRLVRDLETHVGFDLFQRNGPIISPTEQGMRFFEEAQRVIANLDHLKERARAIKESRISAIDIVATPTMAAGLVAPILSNLCDVLPKLVHIETTNAERVVHNVRQRAADLGFSAFPVDHERLTCLAKFESCLVAVVKEGGIYDTGDPLPLSLFSDVRLATVGNSFRVRSQIMSALNDQNIALKAEILTNSSLNAVMAARSDLGIAICDPVTAFGVPVEGVSVRPIATHFKYGWGMFSAIDSNIEDHLTQLTDAFLDVSEDIISKTNNLQKGHTG